MIDLSQFTFKELIKLRGYIGIEVLKRGWFIIPGIILIILIWYLIIYLKNRR